VQSWNFFFKEALRHKEAKPNYVFALIWFFSQIQGLLLLPRQPFTQKAHCNGSEKQWARCGYDRRRRQRRRSRQVR